VVVQKALQLVRARRLAQLAHRFRFDLADPLARDVELLATSSSVWSFDISTP
jgi:hypothetical protein